jgi:hypothetical protein
LADSFCSLWKKENATLAFILYRSLCGHLQKPGRATIQPIWNEKNVKNWYWLVSERVKYWRTESENVEDG